MVDRVGPAGRASGSGGQGSAAEVAGARSFGAAVVAAGRDVARLVLPVECPGCGRPDELLCPDCAAALAGPPVRCEAAVPRLDRMNGEPPVPVWAVAPYVGPVRGVVVAWKDRGRADLTRFLVRVVRGAGGWIAPALAAARITSVSLVPVPTTAAARRRRGADLVRLLAHGVAEGLADGGVPARVRPVLRRRRRRDQVGLGARSRLRNTAGSVVVRGCGPGAAGAGPRAGLAGQVVLLVDDVVTTGSTLAACREALEGAGALVVGVVVLAATPAPSGGRSG